MIQLLSAIVLRQNELNEILSEQECHAYDRGCTCKIGAQSG